MVKCFWAKRETDYLGFIVGNCIVRTSPSKVAADMQNMVIWYPYSSLGNEVGWAGVSGKGEKAKG